MKRFIILVALMGVVFTMSPSTAMAASPDVEATVTARLVSVLVVENNVAYGVLDAPSTLNEPLTQVCSTTTNPAFTITNDGNAPEDFLIRGWNSDPAGWTLGATAGAEQYVHRVAINPTTCTFSALTVTPTTFVTTVAANGTQDVYLQLDMPTSPFDTTEQTLIITITATAG